jgi:hypothetical protein
MKKLLLLTAATAMIGGTAMRAEAQVSVNTTINLQIPELLFIDVTSDNLVIPTPDFAQLEAGATAPTSHAVRHRGNVAHTITVAPATGVTSWTGPTGTTKDVDDLEWSLDASAWNVVSAATNVGTGVKGGFGLNPNIPVWWRSAVTYDELAGDYSIVVTYTSTAN